jgi:hypothetical protein
MILSKRSAVRPHEESTWVESMKRSILQYNERRKSSKDRSRHEVEYDRQRKECTFKPTISQYVFSTTVDERRKRSQDRMYGKKKAKAAKKGPVAKKEVKNRH